MTIRFPALARPRGWLLIAVLAIGAGTSFWGYQSVARTGEIPTIPQPAIVWLLQRAGAEDSKPPQLLTTFFQDTTTTMVQVCAANDVLLFFETDNPIPATTSTAPDQGYREEARLFPGRLRPSTKGKSLLVPGASTDLDGGLACHSYLLDGEWMANSAGSRTALKVPEFITCDFQIGNSNTFDFGRHGRWQARTTGDCFPDYMDLQLAAAGIVESGPTPVDPDDPNLGSLSTDYYDANARIQLEDTRLAGELARASTWRGVVLGVGLTFLAEGVLGIASSLTDVEERKRTWRRRQTDLEAASGSLD